MPDSPLLKSLCPRNILSFGLETAPIELGPLNVLIGPNGSGKTNFLELIGLLQSLPSDLTEIFSQGGGIGNWIWKGRPDAAKRSSIEAVVSDPYLCHWPVSYAITLAEVWNGPGVQSEKLREVVPDGSNLPSQVPFDRQFFASELSRQMPGNGRSPDIGLNQSVLAQLALPELPQVVRTLARIFKSIRLYREWPFGRSHPAKRPQPTDLPSEYLQENIQNLAHVINRLRNIPKIKDSFIEHLRRFYDGFKDLEVTVQFGSMMLYLQEHAFPESSIPATRVSDGTLRWLSLLAILLNPTPPPLVCIEEPEIGLHPDMMHVLAELLRDASERMQLIVTTHSEILVDAFTSTPEVVVVCEKEEGATTMRRLDREKLAAWLKDYSLGNLWLSGEIGGNRW